MSAEAFNSCHVVEWTYCKEFHKDGGKHFHRSIKFSSSALWGLANKRFLRDYNLSLNFQPKTYRYVAAYRCIIKEKDISTVLHSQGHTPLECIKSPKTKKAFERFSQVSSEKKKRKLEENSYASRAPAKPVQLTNVDVSNIMVRQGIKTEDELLSLAWAHAQDSKPDLKSFVLNKARADLIETTWRMQGSSRRLEWSRKTRMQVISKTLNSDCVETCREKHWLKCAKKILRNNKINQYFFHLCHEKR